MRFFIFFTIMIFSVSHMHLATAQIYVPRKPDNDTKKTPFFYDWFKKPSKTVQQTLNSGKKSASQTKPNAIAGSNITYPAPDNNESYPAWTPPPLTKNQMTPVRTTQNQKTSCSTKDKKIYNALVQYGKTFDKNIYARARGNGLRAAQAKSYKQIETYMLDANGRKYLSTIAMKCAES